tara:strand:- start:364 stop:588 length:225 start_codon:yes stop_codon:yes gene_type:complete
LDIQGRCVLKGGKRSFAAGATELDYTQSADTDVQHIIALKKPWCCEAGYQHTSERFPFSPRSALGILQSGGLMA